MTTNSDKKIHTLADFAGQAEFFSKTATLSKKGDKTTIPRSAGLEHFETHGVTRDILEAVHTAETSMLGGLTALAATELKKRIAAAREAGEDAAGLSQTASVGMLGGSHSVRVVAKRDRPNRMAKDAEGNPIPDARSIKFGDIDVDIDAEKSLPTGLASAVAADIEAALG